MASLSYVSYSGNGTQTDFTFPFTYLSTSDVFVYINGVSIPFTFLSSSAVRSSVAPAAGTVIQIRRITQKSSAPVNFTDGSVLLEVDLDTLATYSLYIAQEGADLDDRISRVENTILGLGNGGLPGTLYVQRVSGDGVTAAFTLSATPSNVASVDVFIGGLYQNHNTFGINGSVLTFTEAPPVGTLNIEFKISVAVAIGVTSADLVTYTAGGAGAVARTMQTKERDLISVRDFGAVGDGVTNDSTAFQSAVNALPATGGRILVPDAAYVLTTVPTIGIKSIYWDIGTAATFSGAGTGQGLFPYMMTNTAQLAVGPYIRSQSRQKSTNSNGGIAALNVEMLIPDDNGAGQSVGIYAGLRTNNATPLANGWAANFLVSVQSAALGTHQVLEIDADCNSSAALVKGIGISGGGNANPDVALEITRASMRWDRGVDIFNSQDALSIHPVSGGRGIIIGSPVAQVDTSVSAKQAAINADIMIFQRFTDTGQGGNLMRLVNAANSSNLFIVDTSGNLSCGLINAIGAITTSDAINGNFIIGNNLRASVGAVPAPVGTLAIGSSLASTATAGGNGALPAQVAQYIIVYQGATQLKIPAYNA